MEANNRVEWADVAKGISIILVVLWHSTIKGDGSGMKFINSVNEGLIFLRMPLFFFVSGFFIKKSLAQNWQSFFQNKISNLLWLFLIWSIINDITFYTMPELIKNHVFNIINPLIHFIDPPATLWFIYALAIGFITMKIIKEINALIMLPIFLLIYFFAASDGQWRDVDFINRLARLVPFMYLGSITFSLINQKIKDWHLYFLPIVFALPFFYKWLMESSLKSNSFITFFASVIGLLSLTSFSYVISTSQLGHLLRIVGANSLYIYVMHKIVIHFSKLALNFNPYFNSIISFFLVFIIGISLPLFIKRYLVKGKLIYLFKKPIFTNTNP